MTNLSLGDQIQLRSELKSKPAVASDCSSFVRDAVDAELVKLRHACAIARELKRGAFERRWARSARSNAENERDFSTSDAYWDERQSLAQASTTAGVDEADKALADFIAGHRHFMGVDWVGNDHGRLCWGSFLGGLPIDRHYCQDDEGHAGFCQGDKGAWPKGIRDESEWWRIKKSCDHGESIEWDGNRVCACCGKPVNHDS